MKWHALPVLEDCMLSVFIDELFAYLVHVFEKRLHDGENGLHVEA